MNSFVHQGLNVEIAAPYEVEAGGGVLRGALFGIARSWASAGDTVEISTAGVFDLQRCADESWQVGDRIYWNDDTKCFTAHANNAVLVGFAVGDSEGMERPFGRVKLIGHAM
jgi:predicted RecA/RadA family phage recombinase